MKIKKFVCKKISLIELFICSFNISKTDYLILKNLMKCNKEKNILEISKSLKKERSTIQKSISRLMKKGLVKRRQINLNHGGYSYYYSSINKSIIKRKMKEIINSWVKSVKISINEM